MEKIKTIGDCYMAVAGVPDPSPDHARKAALLALEMRDAVAASNGAAQPGLELRIGINSGPLVAGVIGTKRFLYDLWGDAVNTASRMESHGTPGEIQITRATYELVKDEFVCRSRGWILVKGKGPMETWFLERAGPAMSQRTERPDVDPNRLVSGALQDVEEHDAFSVGGGGAVELVERRVADLGEDVVEVGFGVFVNVGEADVAPCHPTGLHSFAACDGGDGVGDDAAPVFAAHGDAVVVFLVVGAEDLEWSEIEAHLCFFADAGARVRLADRRGIELRGEGRRPVRGRWRTAFRGTRGRRSCCPVCCREERGHWALAGRCTRRRTNQPSRTGR